MFHRSLNIIKSRIFMLFGARGTGKSTLLRHRIPDSAHWIDLLNLDLEARYLADPQTLDRELLALEKN